MEILQTINFIFAAAFFLCYFYQFFYIPAALFKKEKPHKPEKKHRFAVLICARNEEKVIGNLIESIRRQTYGMENIRIFVMADNCTDSTAAAARRAGAFVYKRFSTDKIGKGFALEALLENILRDYPKSWFDGFFVFDADNVLEENYIEEMNRTFCDGYRIITSYRNSKNYGDNWISAGYALWFLRESRYLNGARMLLGNSCAVSGTGFFFCREILEECGGWPFHLLTEDIEFSVHNIVNGEKIGFCKKAVLYDEQPTSFRQSWRQRMRWAKGYLQVFGKYGKSLLSGIAKGDFSSFDMTMNIMPAAVLSVCSVAINSAAAVFALFAGESILPIVFSAAESLFNMYITLFLIGAVTTISEWKRIHTSPVKKIFYTFTFPLFMFTYIPISFAALFRKVEWKPITHSVSVTLAEIREKKSA
ncbi:MAG: glycosyltransferase family 2 protein [Oscillospiraceae bacterium]|nr:glycosyltransferase family 2 protein [Oscillospiraceae bacterium]